MGVYFGDKGRVIISRTASQMSMYTTLQITDVAVDRQRLSITGAALQLITGDRVQFKTQNNTNLQFAASIAGADTSVTRYVHVDGMGGIRLYDTFSDAVRGGQSRSLLLTAPTAAQDITVRVVGEPDQERCVADVRNFTITTSRENIDITCLNQHFRNNYENGLIAGQGSLNCFWTYETDCGGAESGEVEFAEYLASLCIRVVQGASFAGYFYLYRGADGYHGGDSTWYECQDCIITNVAVNVEPTQMVTAEIQFVTSGPIVLRHGRLEGLLLQEESAGDGFDLFDLEQDANSHIELENYDG
jgi:hypothetical protein